MSEVHFNNLSPDEVNIALNNLPYRNKDKLKRDFASLSGIPTTFGACDSTQDRSTLIAVRVALAISERPDLPQIVLQITIGYEHPNAYPSVVVLKPQAPWVVRKGHRHVDTQGTSYLQSVSSWNPQRSNLRTILDEALVVYRQDYPFERFTGTSMPSQGGSTQQQASQPDVGLALGAMALSAMATGVRTLAGVGTTGSGGTATTTSAPNQQRAQDKQWLKAQQTRDEAVRNETPQQMAYIVQEFKSLTAGAAKPSGTVIVCPRGFGVPSIRLSAPRHFVQMVETCPPPLPPVSEPTPQQQFEVYLSHKEEERKQTRAKDLSAKTGASYAKGLLAKGASFAGQAYAGLEQKVWDEHKAKGAALFRSKFPAVTETFVEGYGCCTMNGEGRLVEGTMHITQKSVCFSATEGDYAFIAPLPTVVSIVRGACMETSWLLLIMNTGHVAVFGNFTSYLGSIGTILSGLTGTSTDRAYNWIDHMWRACTTVPCPGFQYATPPSTTAAAVQGPTSVTKGPSNDAMTCVVCMDAPRSAFFQPCGHMVTCMPCSQTLGNVCPMCRTNITTILTAFT
jgi:hypothetical protein